jgi:hypothetical protein
MFGAFRQTVTNRQTNSTASPNDGAITRTATKTVIASDMTLAMRRPESQSHGWRRCEPRQYAHVLNEEAAIATALAMQ